MVLTYWLGERVWDVHKWGGGAKIGVFVDIIVCASCHAMPSQCLF
jgi:hypothetical protein